LKTIAATKAFDVDGSGMNSIECARQSPAFDVLIWASEDKERSEAEFMDAEIEMQKHR
jgi:hypothetical protein